MTPLLWLLGNPALADAPPCGAREAPPALAVVIWSRENPNPGLFGISIGAPAGDREAEMREALLDALFGLDGLLESGDAISVFPQGIDANSDAATAIKARMSAHSTSRCP
jgi:hypothetical protein